MSPAACEAALNSNRRSDAITPYLAVRYDGLAHFSTARSQSTTECSVGQTFLSARNVARADRNAVANRLGDELAAPSELGDRHRGFDGPARSSESTNSCRV